MLNKRRVRVTCETSSGSSVKTRPQDSTCHYKILHYSKDYTYKKNQRPLSVFCFKMMVMLKIS